MKLLVPALLTALALSPALAADWPFFRGPNRNGILAEKLDLLSGGAKKLWEAEVGKGNGGPAIAGRHVFISASKPDRGIACLDAETGRQIWLRPLDSWSLDPTPSVDNGKVFFLTSNAAPHAICVDAASGRILWDRELPKPTGDRQYGHAGSAHVWEDLVIFNAGGGVALKKETGEVVWSHAGFPGLATPVVFTWKNKPCVAIFGGDRLTAREARTGRELFQIPWGTQLAVNACDPIVFGEKIFLCSDYGFGRALFDFRSGEPKPLWEFKDRGGHAFSTGFLHGGAIYCFTADHFVCLDLATGHPSWREPGGGSALLIGDKCIRLRSRGDLIIGRLSPEKFEELQTASLGISEIKNAPAYANGRLIARGEKGEVVCLQIGTSTKPR